MSKITEALAKMDTANDNHWTSDGLPRIDTIRMFAADPTLSREIITAEAPNFSRSNPVLPGAEPAAPFVPPAETAPAVVPATTTEAPVTETTVTETTETKVETNGEEDIVKVLTPADYDVLIEQAQVKLQTAIDARNNAQSAVDAAQNEMDDLINEKHDAGPSDTNALTIQGYLLSQQKDLTERGRRSKVLQESGVTLRDIQALIPQASPLDQAIASRKK